jgi:hypothetical protein
MLATKTAKISSILIISAGTELPHNKARFIGDVDPNEFKKAGVVLIATEAQIKEATLKVEGYKAARIVAINPDMNGFADQVDRAVQNLMVALPPSKQPSKSLLRSARACSAEIPLSIFGELGAVIEQLARLAGAPAAFIVADVIAAISSIVSGRFEAYLRDEFILALIAWTSKIGDASSNKTPAGNTVFRPIRKLEAEARRNYQLAVKAAKAVKDPAEAKAALNDIPPPHRVILGNYSIESAMHLAAQQNRCVGAPFDELADFFAGIKRYSKSAAGDRGLILSSHNGLGLSVDRRSLKEPLMIEHWGLVISGGLQPSVLGLLAREGELDDGMSSRFLHLYPNPAPILARPEPGDEQGPLIWEKLVTYLFNLRVQETPVEQIRFTDEARTKFEDWRVNLLETARKQNREVDSWTGKIPGCVVRLCGILACIDAGLKQQKPKEISVDVLRRAAALAEVLTLHRRKVEAVAGSPTLERCVGELCSYILRHKLETINSFEIRRGAIPMIRSEDMLRKCLHELAAGNWITDVISMRKEDPLPISIRVNPEVHKLDLEL